MLPTWSKVIGVLAGVACILAGLYLATTESASEEATIFDALFQAMGIYFIARGAWMIAMLGRTGAVTE
jgi:hypothetical protein